MAMSSFFAPTIIIAIHVIPLAQFQQQLNFKFNSSKDSSIYYVSVLCNPLILHHSSYRH